LLGKQILRGGFEKKTDNPTNLLGFAANQTPINRKSNASPQEEAGNLIKREAYKSIIARTLRENIIKENIIKEIL
jgi:hypothetical protein